MQIKNYIVVDNCGMPACFNDFRYMGIEHLIRERYTKQEAQYIALRLNECIDTEIDTIFFIQKVDSPCECNQLDPCITCEANYE